MVKDGFFICFAAKYEIWNHLDKSFKGVPAPSPEDAGSNFQLSLVILMFIKKCKKVDCESFFAAAFDLWELIGQSLRHGFI